MRALGPAIVIGVLAVGMPASAQDAAVAPPAVMPTATVPADTQTAAGGAAAAGGRVSSRQDGGTRPALTLGVNFSGGSNGNTDPSASPSSVTATGAPFISDLSTDLKYLPLTGPFTLSLTAQSAARKYSTIKKAMVLGHTAGGAATWTIGRTSVDAEARYAYQPSYTLAREGGVSMLPPAPDGELVLDSGSGALTDNVVELGVAKQPSHRRGGTLGVTYALSRRMRMSLDGGRQRAVFTTARDRDFDEWRAGARWTYDVARGFGLRLGYAQKVAQLDAQETEQVLRDLDIGIDTQRGMSLSLSKNTRLDAKTGSSITHTESRGYRLHATGDVTVTHFIARSANAGARYTRAAEFLEGFVKPVYTDSFALGGGGRVGRKLQYGVQASVSTGYVGEQGRGNTYEQRSAGARVAMAIAPWAHGYMQYLIYRHDIGDDVVTMPGVPRDAMRQTLRFGLTFDFTLASVAAAAPAR